MDYLIFVFFLGIFRDEVLHLLLPPVLALSQEAAVVVVIVELVVLIVGHVGQPAAGHGLLVSLDRPP